MARAKYLFEKPFFGGGDPSYKQLKNIPEQEIDAIIKDFEEGTPVIAIKKKYPYFSSRPFKLQLPFILSAYKCERCDGPRYYRLARKPGTGRVYTYDQICADCGHNDSFECSCKYCVKEYEEDWDKLLSENYSSPKPIEKLNVLDKTHLQALIKTFYNEEKQSLDFPRSNESRGYYAETLPEAFASTIRNFIDRQILVPNREHNRHLVTEEFNFETAELYKTFQPISPTNTYWVLNLEHNGTRLSFQDFQNLSHDQDYSSRDKSLLWRRIYHAEILQYTEYYTIKILGIQLDDLYYDYITDVLIEKFSLSQAFALIYFATRSTLMYKTEHNPRRKNLISNFRNNIMRNAKRYADKELHGFNRPHAINLSYENELILRKTLKIKGDYFFSETQDIVPNYQPWDSWDEEE